MRWIKRLGLLLLVLIIGVGVLLGIIYVRGVSFPKPTGAFTVGVRELAVVDVTRGETFTPQEDDKRELLLTVYYPAQVHETDAVAPYVDDRLLETYSAATGMPAFLYSMVRVNHYEDMPIARTEAPYPVIIFSPGIGTLPLFYSSLLENLASHGYVVVAVNHSYSSLVSVLPDGRVLEASEAGSTRLVEADDVDAAAPIADAIRAVWVADLQFVLDELQRLNTDLFFADTLDLEYIAVTGHSFGGVSALALADVDTRVDALVNLDGTLYGEVTALRVSVPTLIWRSEPPVITDEALQEAGVTRAEIEKGLADFNNAERAFLDNRTDSYSLTLIGSAHNTYALDFALFRKALPFALPPALVGTIDGETAFTLISDTILAFLNTHLKQQGSFQPHDDEAVHITYP